MKRQPMATVRVIRLPHVHADAVRVEIECPSSVTGMTSVPGPDELATVELLVTAAVFEHERRCGECLTDEAHRKGDQDVRAYAERGYALIRKLQLQRRAADLLN